MIPSPSFVETQLGDKHKEDYLYRVRNSFTHNATFAPGVHSAQLPLGPAGSIEWTFREQYRDKKFLYSIYSYDWPGAVTRALKAGLAARLLKLM